MGQAACTCFASASTASSLFFDKKPVKNAGIVTQINSLLKFFAQITFALEVLNLKVAKYIKRHRTKEYYYGCFTCL